MNSHVSMVKGKAGSRMNGQQAAFELKQRVGLALNKLGDRDTCQIGVEELEKTIECLPHDGIAPFLSCIMDTDSEQKCAVRKECIRLMGKLATFHEILVAPHLGRMVASIVKRLKDTDSAVRDICVETVGILASKLSGNRVETDSTFVVLVRPLFEALGEQNKQVQSGSALCLSSVIDNIHDPPPLVLQKMLARTVKLLKNQHFMAKPAVIELNRSIILAGGAPTPSSLIAALTSIQEATKNSEWATRKAACNALGDIASCLVSSLGTFRKTVICCLESCRFDKVKPVRDAALLALQLWKNLPGSVTPEPSENGSSVKGISYTSDYGDVTSSSGSKLNDIKQMRSACELAKKRVPLSSRTAGGTNIEKSQQSGTNDWQIEITIPKNHQFSVSENQDDDSECSSVTKRCEKIYTNVRSKKNIGYNYVELDDKQEFSSASTLFTESIKSKVVPIHCDVFDVASLVKSTGTSRRFANDEANIEEQRYLAKMHDHRSLNSTVRESTSQIMRGCCLKTEKDLILIRKQLFEIEDKQTNLMDMLKAFTTTIADSMSVVQLKVSNLELVVDKIAQELVHGGRYPDMLANKVLKSSPSIVSPRLSGSTPRASVESNGHPPFPPTKHAGKWENTFIRGRSNGYGKQNSDTWSDATPKLIDNSLGKSNNSPSFCSEIYDGQTRTNGNIFNPNPCIKSRLNKLEAKKNPRKLINDYILDGNFDFAYEEALCSRNEFLLFELLDKTGPVLENLSQKTANELLSTLAKFLLEQRFVNFIIPWFQQLADLSNIHGPTYLALSPKLKRDLIASIQESANVDGFKPAERNFFIELAKMMRHVWGNRPC
ncbi:TORTIFOLIA1-like protein 2 isoform X1 [Primulina huaijiensis]|uniref:TORTIFOLIA1-like protein 2 isoform X1 n=2 Tax=Primulina huaijiensis TaxID=1492673 RepID=UPI003CC76FFC